MFAQGRTYTQGAVQFTINYAGGNGNDVTAFMVISEPSIGCYVLFCSVASRTPTTPSARSFETLTEQHVNDQEMNLHSRSPEANDSKVDLKF